LADSPFGTVTGFRGGEAANSDELLRPGSRYRSFEAAISEATEMAFIDDRVWAGETMPRRVADQ
jgi:hypothetical protein